ncbi:protein TRIGALACTOSYLDIACYLGLYCEROL 2, chloroplastic-like [Hordeum vulgare]|nr:protein TRIGALACTOSYLDIACYLGLYCEROL 2, chloroplastic-like [Hordeum vulgare]
MRRLPAAPARPVLHPHISPALGVPQQHGRVAMARTTPAVCCSYLLPNRRTPTQGAEFEPLRSRSTDRDRGSAMARANPAAASGGEASPSPSPSPDGGSNPFAPLVELWRRTVQPLGDYGFGKRSVWEGGVGLFMVSGAALLALALAWLRGFQLRSRFRKYSAVFEFSQACGICVGTPLRIRGVTVGSVVRVDSSLRSIDAYVEVEDDKIIVPRNSLVEVNQSGLLMETMIDITPKDPLPTPSVGPLDADCFKEGLILCDKERMKGQPGVSLDAMVGIFTRLGRDMEEIGVHKSFKLAEKVASIMEEAQPLLSRVHSSY